MPAAPDPGFEARLEAAIQGTRPRYRGWNLNTWCYASWKVVLDPCYRAVAHQVPPSSLTVDLGSGFGLLACVLAQLGEGRRVLGVEYDRTKHRAGLRATRDLPQVHLELGDIRTFPIPACQTLTCLDVLHYLQVPEQRALLRRAFEALKPGGRILVRETDASRQGGTRFTRAFERFALALGFNRGGKPTFRTGEAWAEELRAAGFQVEASEVAHRLNPGNLLLVGLRPPT
ncbi:MAG TPA: class I SAM-dependent methyltransferase [Holophagaceae bacterium]|nr:class I SAM-dependent methyltransferase [Holophagaceae bacterium]